MDANELFDCGYFNYYFSYKFNNQDCIADAEFGNDDEFISLVIYDLDEFGMMDEIITEIMPNKLDKKFIQKVTNEWKKTRNNKNNWRKINYE